MAHISSKTPRVDRSHLMDHTKDGWKMPNKALGERERAKEQKRQVLHLATHYQEPEGLCQPQGLAKAVFSTAQWGITPESQV